MARLTVICGLPGSGKTTLARQLVARTGALRMCPDEWMTSLGASLWDEDLRARLEGMQWQLGQALLLAGTDVVIEWGTWARVERDALRDWCRANGVDVSLRHLDVDPDELWRRLDARNGRPGEVAITRDELLGWVAGPFQPPTADELASYDPDEEAPCP